MDGRYYDSMDGIGRVESGTETENNAGAIVEEQLPKDLESRMIRRLRSFHYATLRSGRQNNNGVIFISYKNRSRCSPIQVSVSLESKTVNSTLSS